MKKIGVIPNRLKDKDLKTTSTIIECLEKQGFEVYITPHIGKILNKDKKYRVEEEQLYHLCDIVIAIGGDGTFLSVANKASKADVPIIGVNLGRLGFLVDIEPNEIKHAVDKLLKGDYVIEKRMMLQARIIEPNGAEHIFYALNDISLTRGSFSRISEFEIYVEGNLCDVYPADGVVVATPTGSTAYNLSAGGPIVVPHANAYLVTPICPHTIYSRSILLSEQDHMTIRTCSDVIGSLMELSVDGKMKIRLTPEHLVEIEKAPYVTKIIKLSELGFFEILRKKIVERRR